MRSSFNGENAQNLPRWGKFFLLTPSLVHTSQPQSSNWRQLATQRLKRSKQLNANRKWEKSKLEEWQVLLKVIWKIRRRRKNTFLRVRYFRSYLRLFFSPHLQKQLKCYNDVVGTSRVAKNDTKFRENKPTSLALSSQKLKKRSLKCMQGISIDSFLSVFSFAVLPPVSHAVTQKCKRV